MKENKNIERLFQERFRDFESDPPADVWKNINKKLHSEKELQKNKKAIPLWIKLSGIAAALLLGFFAINSAFFDTTTTQTDITHTEALPIQDKNDSEINSTTQQIVENNSLTQRDENSVSEVQSEENKIEIQSAVEKNQVVYSEEKTITQNNAKQLVHTSQKVKNQEIYNQTDTDIAVANLSEKERNTHLSENNFTENKSITLRKNIENENELVLTENPEKSTKTILQTDSDLAPKQNSIFSDDKNEEIASETIPEEKEEDPNELQKLLEEKQTEEDDDEQEIAFNKWKITPNIAPVSMNSLSQGSPISEEFATNSKDFQTLLSYGLGVNYAISQKLSIRTGINKLAMGYNTNDVVVYVATKNADVLANQTNLILDANNSNLVIKPEGALTSEDYTTSQKGYINQRIGYVEVPVELSYKLIDSRFGIDVVGGLSTLFLSENEVSVISNGRSIPLGEAGNLNNVHFSTNIGLGFRYELFKSFEASVEPMFKYQIGTFSRNDGNFKPYILGLYTGLSFKF